MTHCRRIMLEELQRRNFAPTTVRSYLSAVERFARHFKCRPDRLNQTHLRSYQAYLLRTGQLMPRTVRLHVAALRFFFVKTLKRRYLLDDTPYPKAPRRLPTILSVEEMARLIDAADGLYHHTMLMVLHATGMRSAELLHLQVADIDSRRMLIHISSGLKTVGSRRGRFGVGSSSFSSRRLRRRTKTKRRAATCRPTVPTASFFSSNRCAW